MKIILLLSILGFGFGSENSPTHQVSAEPQIRSVLCAIKNKDYTTANSDLEKILRQEPKNIYAHRLLPGVIAHRIRKGDKSAANIAQIRKAIDAFRQFANNPLFAPAERSRADELVFELYKRISEDEWANELLKAAEDKTKTPKARSSFYSKLAARSYTCADNAISTERRPANTSIAKAKDCIAKGLGYTEQAIALDGASEAAWSYKASLLSKASKVAGLEKDTARKSQLQMESTTAVARFKELSAQRNAELDKIPQNEPGDQASEAPPKVAEELVEYKAEKPLTELVSELYIPDNLSLAALVAPPDDDTNGARENEAVPEDSAKQKREWKTFSPGDDLSLELPDNAFQETPNQTDASSEGVRYQLISNPIPALQSAFPDDPALNALAWGAVRAMRNLSLLGTNQTRFETRLLNKANIGNRPARTYAFKVISCSKTMEGTLLVVIGKSRNYAILIIGANERDPRTERVIRSVNFK